MGEERLAPGGVLDHGTQEEDAPGTWEALALLDTIRSHGESGDPFSDAGAQADRAQAVAPVDTLAEELQAAGLPGAEAVDTGILLHELQCNLASSQAGGGAAQRPSRPGDQLGAAEV